ncbi:MAG TPA: ABC transporter permease [Burkholderiales bacterium]|jgi:ABC-type lipoprotein release transport system permease subunit|nr:ABC transporter permease [Burkholderiales bacterium]
MLIALAWRNVLRNRRRSAITVSSIAIGLAAMTFLWGMIDGINRQMVENTTRYFAGDAQIHLKGYHDDPTFDLAMRDAARVLRAARSHPEVAAASLRLEGKALASRGDKSRGVTLAGVAPQDEARVTVLFKSIIEGQALGDGVLIGEKLAEALRVRAGEELVFLGQAYDGSVASARFSVRGVFRSKIDELDGFVAVTTLDAAREFYAAPQGATGVVLRLRDAQGLEALRSELATRLGERYEVLGWPRLLPMVAVSIRFHEVVSYVVLLVFFVVVAAAVANPVLMSVLERTRELGIVLALGMSRSRLLGLVLLESMLLGSAGVIAGNALGLSITGYFAAAGMNVGAFEAGLRTMPGLSDVIFPVLLAERSFMLSALVFAIACLTAVYPAAKAAGLEPVDAIRGLRGPARAAARAGWRIRLPVFLLIGMRNLLRNPRRTAIMVAGTTFGIVGYVFVLGFFDGFFENTIENSTRYITGHVQVERPGFRRELAPELALERPDALLARLRSVPGVAAAAPRVQAQGLASSAAKSEGITLVGIDPLVERGVTFIDRTLVEGEALAPGAQREAMIGRELAQKLRLKLGEKIVVMAQAADGELGTAAYRVSGIFATESASFDGAFVFVTLAAAQSLLALDARVSTINLRLDERSHTTRAVEELRALFEPGELAFAPWQELLPQLEEMVQFNRVVTDILLAVLLLVVATAIMNTVFMALAERTRELGVMMALGTSPGALVRMVVYETVALLLTAALVGYAAGIAGVAYLGRAGMDLSGFFQGYAAIPGLTGVVYPQLMSQSVAPPGIALIVLGVLVSLYPATKAARLEPSVAIRHA